MELLFRYKEVDNKTGKVVQGEMRAASREEVVENIRKKGSTPVKIEQIEQKSQSISFGGKVKVKDLAIYCKQLNTMLAAGMPLTVALDVMEGQTEKRTLKRVSNEMCTKVQTGAILSEAMLEHKKTFPPLLVTMVKAGEMTGKLDEVLGRMSIHYEKENKINSKIKGAMIYPIILMVLLVVVVVAMLTFILPQFTSMFETSGKELPFLTQMLIKVSDSLRDWWYIHIGIVVAIFVSLHYIKKTPNGKRSIDRFVIRIPFIGNSIRKIATSRFTRTLSTLLSSGIPIISALSASADVTNNTIVQDGMEYVVEDVKKGMNISQLLKKMGFFPMMMISMLSIGEETGELESMLAKTADFYDEELDSTISKLLTALEPTLIIIMALIIGIIVVAIMLPIFNLASTIQ